MKYIDLFAGIGGFRYALDDLGMECVLTSEKDKIPLSMYKDLHGDEGVFINNVEDITIDDLPEHDLAVAGIPCQPFSQNGKKTGFNHETGSMFFEMLRVAKLRKTKYILIENVFGILTNDNKNTITTILSVLSENGYSVDFDLLTSYNFSVPQDRKRVFIVGVLNGEYEEWDKNKNKTVNKIKDVIINKNPDIKTFNFPYPKGGDKNTLISDILDKDTSKTEYLEFNEGFLTTLGNNHFRIKDGTKKGYTDFEAIPFSTTIDYKFQTSKTRRGRVKQGISKTLDQAMEVAVYDGYGFRRLSQLEVFRLQGFPDEAYFTLKNNEYRDSQLYARPSRSITIPLVKEIGQALLDYDKTLKGG